MNEGFYDEDELKKEIAYYKKQLDQRSGQMMRHDLMITSMRHSLKQKNDVFAVLITLQKKFTVSTAFETLLAEMVKAITTNLGMNRTVALIPCEGFNTYRLSHHYGYPSDFFSTHRVKEIEFAAQYKAGQHFLVNKKTLPDETCKKIQTEFGLNFFVGVPLIHNDKPAAFILTGRTVQSPPFSPVLDKGDIDSLTAITSMVSAVLQNQKSVQLELQKTEVEKENEIITAQRNLLEQTLNELKAMQQQLIQSEKMASLGELTAGIAHEIQNPLNFVNNFSDLNKELLVEMKEEIDKGNLQEVKSIANDVMDNEQKINHHGKRADAIVKGMLQHSRSSTSEKEPTNINKLADEYLRLCYHGLRAKDQFFNANMQTDFDQSLKKINIIPQDIGRVILNLITNAFYSVVEKKKQIRDNYEPTVSLSTKKIGNKVEIKVSDNGNGIPQKILDKIFQPFFTTKPTGQGTGLGLSLSYDIITKGHGGELKVETKEGEGSAFTISLNIEK